MAISADEARVAHVVTNPLTGAAKDTLPGGGQTRAGNASARSALYPWGYRSMPREPEE